jgi:hypothetical protein
MFPVQDEHPLHIKSKAIPITGHGGLWVFKTSRIPHFLESKLTDGNKVFSLTGRPRFNTHDRWYSFLSEAQETPRDAAAVRIT